MLVFMVEDGNRICDGMVINDPVTKKGNSVLFCAKYRVPVKSGEFVWITKRFKAFNQLGCSQSLARIPPHIYGRTSCERAFQSYPQMLERHFSA